MATTLSKEIKASDGIEDRVAALFTLLLISLSVITAIPSHSHSIRAIPTCRGVAAINWKRAKN